MERKFDPFEELVLWVLRFFEHPLLEFQKAQFAVVEKRWIVQGDRFREGDRSVIYKSRFYRLCSELSLCLDYLFLPQNLSRDPFRHLGEARSSGRE